MYGSDADLSSLAAMPVVSWLDCLCLPLTMHAVAVMAVQGLLVMLTRLALGHIQVEEISLADASNDQGGILTGLT